MVVFTCNHCGESIQKPRVEKHYSFQCRRPKFLSCVDCLKDFRDEEYAVHTKCFTEEERYAAKGSFQGGIVKKGEAKQETWTEMIGSIVEKENNMSPSLKRLFHTISSYTNVPRKKPKFINFLKSSLGGRINFNEIESAWDLIEKYKSTQIVKNNEKKSSQNGKHKLEQTQEVPAKKHKADEIDANNAASEKFSFKQTILEILKTKSISTKKLQKKVLTRYKTETGSSEVTEKTIKKYNKKLKRIPNISIDNDHVSLLTNIQ